MNKKDLKKKIKWNNIIFLVLNIYGIIIFYLTLRHINIINRTDLTKYRLTIIVIVCYLAIVGGSLVIKNYKRGEKYGNK